jgi:hypothetical protein
MWKNITNPNYLLHKGADSWEAGFSISGKSKTCSCNQITGSDPISHCEK